MDFQLGPYGLEIPTEFGPRVTGLRLGPGPNVMAVLDDDMGLGEGSDRYRFHGGHRIWASPEIPEISYAPDDHSCAVTEREGRITVIAPPDRAGIAKELSVRLDGDRLVVTNALVPATNSSAEIAPWAISQLPGEGLAILPLNGEDTTPLPNQVGS